MTRLERYKDILIPVDDVAYVEYRKPKKNAWSTDGDDNAGTYVHVRDDYVYGSIRIGKKNLLDDFKKWYDETMARIGQNGVVVECGDSLSYPWQIVQTTSEPDGGESTSTPPYCHTTTTSNGETVVTILGENSSSAPSYVERGGTSLRMVQHDGIEHPL